MLTSEYGKGVFHATALAIGMSLAWHFGYVALGNKNVECSTITEQQTIGVAPSNSTSGTGSLYIPI